MNYTAMAEADNESNVYSLFLDDFAEEVELNPDSESDEEAST